MAYRRFARSWGAGSGASHDQCDLTVTHLRALLDCRRCFSRTYLATPDVIDEAAIAGTDEFNQREPGVNRWFYLSCFRLVSRRTARRSDGSADHFRRRPITAARPFTLRKIGSGHAAMRSIPPIPRPR